MAVGCVVALCCPVRKASNPPLHLALHDPAPPSVRGTQHRISAGRIRIAYHEPYLPRGGTVVPPHPPQKTAKTIGLPQLGQIDFLHLLRSLLDSLHRLHVGTLDSFTIGVIRTFPMELGISTSFQVMDSDGAQAKIARQEILARIFNNRYVDRSAQREFLEAFKQATYGQEEKSLERSLDTFITQYRNYYQVLPMPDAWGAREYIWPIGSPWLADVGDVNVIADRLQVLLDEDDLPENILNRWYTFIDAIRVYGNNSPWSRDIEYLSEKLLDQVEALHQGNATIKIDRAKCELSPEESNLKTSAYMNS